MYLSGESIVVILVVGLVAGWLAGKIVQGTGFGLIGDIAIGIVGAFIASSPLPRLGIGPGIGIVRAIINSTIGAVLLLVIIRLSGAEAVGKTVNQNISVLPSSAPQNPAQAAPGRRQLVCSARRQGVCISP